MLFFSAPLLQSHVESNRIMLYMKGNPSQPMCGFSAKVVNILKKEGIDFSSVNVLDYPSIREGVKKYSYEKILFIQHFPLVPFYLLCERFG